MTRALCPYETILFSNYLDTFYLATFRAYFLELQQWSNKVGLECLKRENVHNIHWQFFETLFHVLFGCCRFFSRLSACFCYCFCCRLGTEMGKTTRSGYCTRLFRALELWLWLLTGPSLFYTPSNFYWLWPLPAAGKIRFFFCCSLEIEKKEK